MSQNALLSRILGLIPEADLVEAIEVLQLRLHGVQRTHANPPPKPRSVIGDEAIKQLILDFSNKITSCADTWGTKDKAAVFLDGVQDFYNKRGYLTDKQVEAVTSWIKNLEKCN